MLWVQSTSRGVLMRRIRRIGPNTPQFSYKPLVVVVVFHTHVTIQYTPITFFNDSIRLFHTQKQTLKSRFLFKLTVSSWPFLPIAVALQHTSAGWES